MFKKVLFFSLVLSLNLFAGNGASAPRVKAKPAKKVEEEVSTVRDTATKVAVVKVRPAEKVEEVVKPRERRLSRVDSLIASSRSSFSSVAHLSPRKVTTPRGASPLRKMTDCNGSDESKSDLS